MTLQTGTKIGTYEVLSPLGAGGMGEVYRARDTKLGREVALKVLSDAFAADAERMARFEREAKVLASLNHPNIATIYGMEESGSVRALVMELVEGPTLADLITRGPIPLDEALPIAKQIAEGLEYAHERGIVHRDLKPANVKITADGVAKILDFGLAKALEGETAAGDISSSPTLTHMATQAGIILGTAAYMAPEQAKGKAVDRRADIWAFGCVLYEMLTGKKPFEGETISDVLAAVIKEAPDWSVLPPEAVLGVRGLLERCLQKDVKQRLQAIGEARITIQEVLSGSSVSATAIDGTPGGSPKLLSRRSVWMLGLIGVAVATISGVIAWNLRSDSFNRPLMRFSADLEPAAKAEAPNLRRLGHTKLIAGFPGTSLALSPDGMHLAVKVRDADGQEGLGIRQLNEGQYKPLPGSEGANSPFFSPDNQWIAFFAGHQLKKIAVAGGAAVTLCDANAFGSGSWGDDGTIIAALSRQGTLSRVPAAGGTPTPVTKLQKGEISHRWPQVLPGSEAVVFTAYTGSDPDDASVDVLSLKTHQRKTLVHGGAMGRYMAASNGTGYLVYLHQNTLFAEPFDLSGLATTGSARAILDDVSAWYPASVTPGDFDISRTGTLVYLSGKREPKWSIFWLDHSGETQPLHPEPGYYHGLRFSPDGKYLVFQSGAIFGHEDLWVQDLQRKTVERLTSLLGTSSSPLWSPDGRHILFAVGGQSDAGIYWIRSDGTGRPMQLTKEAVGFPASISPGGKELAITTNPIYGGNRQEILIASIKGTSDRPLLGKTREFLHVQAEMPAFSPDGRWLAYTTMETGTPQVYVQAFPGPGGKVAISVDGGRSPLWSPNGRELFYLGRDRRIWVVSYAEKGGAFWAGKPEVWCQKQILFSGAPIRYYALSPDGKRFAVFLYPNGTAEADYSLSLTFLLNFADELNRRLSPR